MPEAMPFIQLPGLTVPRKEYYAHALRFVSLRIDRWEYQPNSFTDEYVFLLDEEAFSATYQPAPGESLTATQLAALNQELVRLDQSFNTLYALTDSKVTHFKQNDVLPNSIKAAEAGLLVEPEPGAMFVWANVHPMYWFFLDEHYYMNLDFSDAAFKSPLVAYLTSEAGYDKNVGTLLHHAETTKDAALKAMIETTPRPYAELAERAFALFFEQKISLVVSGGVAIGKIDFDTPFDPATATSPPPKRRLNLLFSSSQHRDLNVWEFETSKQPVLHIVSHFFEHRQRVKNDSAMIAGHPMIASIMAHQYLAQRGITAAAPDFDAQALDTATRLIEGARVDFVDSYNADTNKTKKHTKENIALCVDSSEPILKVQAQLTPAASAVAAQNDIALSPSIATTPYYAGVQFPAYGQSQLTIFNPEGRTLHISVQEGQDSIGLASGDSEVPTLTTSVPEVGLLVKSLVQVDGAAAIAVRLKDQSGVVLKSIAVDIQTPKFIPVRFNEIRRADTDPARVDIPTIEQLARDVIAAINHALARQVNFFIYPKTTLAGVQADLGGYSIPHDISGHRAGDVVRKIQLLQVVAPSIEIGLSELDPDFDPALESESTKLIKSFIKLKDLTSDVNFFWFSRKGPIPAGEAFRDPFLPAQVTAFATDMDLQTSLSKFALPLHELVHALGRLLIGDEDEDLDYFKHPPNATDTTTVLFEDLDMGGRVTVYRNNPLLYGFQPQHIRLDNSQIELLREHYREIQ
jgi:hypothetical protein